MQENDSNVKFVPFGFKTGKQSIKELEENSYIIARYGKEGAEKIAEIASNYKNQSYIHSFDSVNEEKIKMSILGEGWNFSKGLVVYGNLSGSSEGRVFGILK